jgi:hypothetical protein
MSINNHAIDLRVAAGLMCFDYESTNVFGSTLDQETGYIPGFTVAALQPYRSIRNTVEFSLYGGDVDYDGQTQSGQPHQTTTEETIYRLLYELSWPPEDSEVLFTTMPAGSSGTGASRPIAKINTSLFWNCAC